MKVVKLHCPDCGAVLDISDDRDIIFCQYCGSKLVIDRNRKDIRIRIDSKSERHSYDHARIEEARAKRTEDIVAAIVGLGALLIAFIMTLIHH